ncbi:MAG: hypothetical protein WAQ83_17825 [Saprospiraceae bacterium]
MQKKEKIVFNKETLQFETVKSGSYLKGIFFTSILLISGLTFGYFEYNTSIRTNTDNDFAAYELKKLEDKYALIDQKLNKFSTSLDKLHKKDAQIYSVVMGVTPVDEDIWQGGTGGKQSNNSFANLFNLNINKIEDKADKLNHQISLQTNSLDKMYREALEHEDYLECVPSIKAV